MCPHVSAKLCGKVADTTVPRVSDGITKATSYTVCPEKEIKMFFCNIFYKTRAILIKFGASFPE